jgi:hypothetical protein
MVRKRFFPIIVFFPFGWALSSCSLTTESGVSATQTIPLTPISLPAQTPTRTQTLQRTAKLSVTRTPTATILTGLNYTGPFLIYTSDKGETFMDFIH